MDIKDVDLEQEGIVAVPENLDVDTVITDQDLKAKEKEKDRTNLKQSKDNLFSHKFLFGVIFSRCRDVSATVRAKVCAKSIVLVILKGISILIPLRLISHFCFHFRPFIL